MYVCTYIVRFALFVENDVVFMRNRISYNFKFLRHYFHPIIVLAFDPNERIILFMRNLNFNSIKILSQTKNS